MLKALIFDVDGTLAETEELHRRAFNETFEKAGLGWHWSQTDYHRLLKTTGGKERIARYMEEIDLPLGQVDIAALHRDKTARYTALMAEGGLDLRPGVRDLLTRARRAGMTLAIATTTSRPNVDALFAATLGVTPDSIFAAVACGDQVPAKKPAPDVYQLALRRLGLSADQCLAFEDSRNGLMSARAAGIECLVTPSIYTADESFPEAWKVLPDLSDLSAIPVLSKLAA